MPNNKFAYLELPAGDVPELKSFYGGLFGWKFADWGTDYAAFSSADAGLDGGFNADPEHKPKQPLAIVEVDAIEGMEDRVRAAGGRISLPTFSFPGGRRFHFVDPSGNELAVMELDTERA